ncbi:hypothetical protein ABGB07_18620 [Micromonosporaceae bacterium B7E4]
MATSPASAAASLPVGRKSARQPSSGSARKTEVPSGAATAASSASAGPRRRGSTGACSAAARSTPRRGSAVVSAKALIAAVPDACGRVTALFSTARHPPCSQSWTGFERCCPVCVKPSPRSTS